MGRLKGEKGSRRLNVVIADDHPLFRRGLGSMLKTNPKINKVIEVGNGSELLTCLKTGSHDVVFLDIIMPIIDGEAAARAIHDRYPNIRIIVISMCEDPYTIRRLYAIGCHGYLVKNADEVEIRFAIDEVMKGGRYFNESILRQITSVVDAKTKTAHDGKLTPTEMKLIPFFCSDQSNKQIAKKLFLSVRTVETHRYNIYSKLGVSNLNELWQYAVVHQML